MKQYDVYEVIIIDARDKDKPEPESSSGLLFSEKDARQALNEMLTGQYGYKPIIISWYITKNGLVIDSPEKRFLDKIKEGK